MDKNTEKRLQSVHPTLKQRIEILIENGKQKGFDIRVTSGYRDEVEQTALHAQGRKSISEVNRLRGNAGLGIIPASENNIVTKAKALQSNHNFGLAVDCVNFKDGQPDWKDNTAFRFISAEGKRLGLESGADWNFKDKPHLQLKGLSVKECARLYLDGGLNKVWAKMNDLLAGVAKPENLKPEADDLIEFGDEGDEVSRLQKQLQILGFIREDEIDGDFGKITKNAVIGFQRLNDLSSDGIVGDETKAKLNKAVENKLNEGKEVDSVIENLKPSPEAEKEEKSPENEPTASENGNQPNNEDQNTTRVVKSETVQMNAPVGQKVGENIKSILNGVLQIPIIGGIIGALVLAVQNYFTSGNFDFGIVITPLFDLIKTIFPNVSYLLIAFTLYKTVDTVMKQFGVQKQMEINANPKLNNIEIIPTKVDETLGKVVSMKDKITSIFK